MSLAQGVPVYLSTAGNVGTRIKGPGVAGQLIDTTAGGPIPAPGGLMVVQSTASLTNQVVTTSDTTIGNRASFIYIPLTTGGLVGAVAPVFTGCGTPIVWNDNSAVLMVWSSSRSSWLSQTVTSSALLGDGKGFTSS